MYKDLLTGEKLLKYGFKIVGKDVLDNPIYRITPSEEYYFEIQVVLSNYPEDNPNAGILSIYHAKQKCSAVPKDLWKKEKWTKEDEKRAEEYTITLKEFNQPIAWGLTSEKRFITLFESLTDTKLKKI